MSGVVNVRALTAGTRVVLASGAEVEIMSNPGDGIWVFGRVLAAGDDGGVVGAEEMVFAGDVLEVRG